MMAFSATKRSCGVRDIGDGLSVEILGLQRRTLHQKEEVDNWADYTRKVENFQAARWKHLEQRACFQG